MKPARWNLIGRFRDWLSRRRLAYLDAQVAEWRTFLATEPPEHEPLWPGEAL